MRSCIARQKLDEWLCCNLKPLGWQGGMASESDAEELGELEEEDYTVLHGLLCCMVLIALMIMH